jgi:hypothetical protein
MSSQKHHTKKHLTLSTLLCRLPGCLTHRRDLTSQQKACVQPDLEKGLCAARPQYGLCAVDPKKVNVAKQLDPEKGWCAAGQRPV